MRNSKQVILLLSFIIGVDLVAFNSFPMGMLLRGMPQDSASRIRENSVFCSSWSQIAVFFCVAISLVLGVVGFYSAISLAPVQLGITFNAEVT